MSTEEESKSIDFEEDILLPFGKRVLAVLAILLIPLVANQLEPLGTVAVIGASMVVWLLIEAVLWVRGRAVGPLACSCDPLCSPP